MLHKVVYPKITDLYHTKFLSWQQGTLVVTGPSEADLWRKQLHESNIKLNSLTFADWVKYVAQACKLSPGEQVTKSSLWDLLHRVWRASGGPNHYGVFQKVFEIYTEVKGLTQDAEIFRQVISIECDLHENVLNAITQLYSLDEIQDEYKTLRMVVDALERGEYLDGEDNKFLPFHIIGFKTFSALQLQAMKVLSKIVDVYIYIPLHLQSAVKNNNLNDWPNWIQEDKVIEIASKNQAQEKRYLIFNEGDYASLWTNTHGQLVTLLGSDEEVPLLNWGQQIFPYRIKNSSLVSSTGASLVQTKVHEQLMKKKCSWAEMEHELSRVYRVTVEEKNDYWYLKWIQYAHEWVLCKIQENKNLSKEEFNWLDFNVLSQKMNLDKTRLFWQAYNKNDESIGIQFLEKSVYFLPHQKNFLIVNETLYSNAKEEKLDLRSKNILHVLGPRSSEEWDKLYNESLLFDFLGQAKDVTLLINQDALEFDHFLKNILVTEEFVPITRNEKSTRAQFLRDTYKFPLEKFMRDRQMTSPSALQTYKNCPRQFYAHHILKLPVNDKHEVQLSEIRKGQIYHELMEYLGKDLETIQKTLNHPENVTSLLLENKLFNFKENIAELYEFREIILHGLQHWSQMIFHQQGWSCTFETEFKVEELFMRGRIDFVSYHHQKEMLVVVDFKKSTVPNYKEIIRFDHWQTLCYVKGWLTMHPEAKVKGVLMGYWNMMDVQDSTFVKIGDFEGEGILEAKDLNMGIDELLSNFSEHWMKTYNAAIQDREFLPRPSDTSVCAHCFLATTCPKGELPQ